MRVFTGTPGGIEREGLGDAGISYSLQSDH